MKPLLFIIGLAILLAVLWDAFEAMVLPRRVTRRIRLTRLFYRTFWRPWSAVARRLASSKRRETFLSYFGPLSLLFLLAWWAFLLILAFALLYSSFEAVKDGDIRACLYMSGTTFLTLGLGDVLPANTAGRVLAVLETGMGFGFLAVVIGYLPVIYQAFSRREVNISMLDSRAGSPATAGELLVRHASSRNLEQLGQLLRDWERAAADLLESHLSYPALAYYRSQHDNESWLAALTAILDACALLVAGQVDSLQWQAQHTFAIARHAVVDLAQVFTAQPSPPDPDRLPASERDRLHRELANAGLRLAVSEEANEKLAALRRLYEPYVAALAERLLMPLPPWAAPRAIIHNWQTTAWERSLIRLTGSTAVEPGDEEHA